MDPELEPEKTDDEAEAPAHPLSWKKRLLFGGLTTLLALLVGLVGLEIILRLADWEVRSLHHIGALHQYHPRLGREQVPGREITVEGAGGAISYTVNAQGFRDPDEVSPQPTPGRPRIIVLGDSLTWGWGVPGDEVLSERLQASTGVEVINLGMNAFGTGEEWLLLEERGLPLEPDVVVLNFYVGNDYRNNLSRRSKKPHFDVGDDGRVVVSNVPVPHPLSKRMSAFAKRHSLAYFFLGYHLGRARIHIKYSDRWYGNLYRTLSPRKRQKAKQEADLGALDPFRSKPTAEMERAYRVTEALLGEFQRSCREKGVRLLVGVVPTRQQVEEDAWVELRTLAEEQGVAVDRQRPSRTCLDLCRRLGIDTIDLQPDLHGSAKSGTPVYIPNDIHWNVAGHRVAAATLHQELDALGWLARKK